MIASLALFSSRTKYELCTRRPLLILLKLICRRSANSNLNSNSNSNRAESALAATRIAEPNQTKPPYLLYLWLATETETETGTETEIETKSETVLIRTGGSLGQQSRRRNSVEFGVVGKRIINHLEDLSLVASSHNNGNFNRNHNHNMLSSC